jgi:isoleucyl-tRNA synthetase
VAFDELIELDQWIISKLQTLMKDVTECYEDFEPHRAARFIENFVDRHLSNWYVRLSRRRFWKQDADINSAEKRGAYETLYQCLKVTAQLMSPIAPFFSDWLFKNLQSTDHALSVHLSNLPKTNAAYTNQVLEERMEIAQTITSMILSIRKKENIRVRQPLSKIQIPVLDEGFKESIQHFEELIKAEVNVKSIEYVTEGQVQIVKNLKLNFKTLGKKFGAHMKQIQAYANDNGNEIIRGIEQGLEFSFDLSGTEIVLLAEDVEIIPIDIPGWKVANAGKVTVALDISITEELKSEGIARELINRIQNIRKESAFEVTDKIKVIILSHNVINTSVEKNINYIRAEILAESFEIVEQMPDKQSVPLDLDEGLSTKILVEKV